MMLSVLIPTLESRREQFQHMLDRPTAQIHVGGMERAVEVSYDCDNRERSLLTKRNALIRRPRGRLIAFDHDISDDYNKYNKSRRWWTYQLLLDRSEPVPHALGLWMVNRLLLIGAPLQTE